MNLNDITNKFRNAICIMAHPDDETCWAGGLILSTPHIKWTIACCSYPRRAEEYKRRWDFYEACGQLKAFGAQNKMVETEPGQELPIEDFLHSLKLHNYDFIVTHGANGDYGHSHHKSVHRQVIEFSKKLWYNKPTVLGTEYRKGDLILKLSDDLFNKKMNVLKSYHINSHKIGGKDVEKWEALLHVYPILKEKKETYGIYNA